MRITKIESQKRRPERKSIYADGEFVAGVSAETLLKLALRTGDELSDAQVEVLKKTEALAGAKNAALRFLGGRMRTVREVRDKLREKEYADGEIASTISELRNAGLLDDAAFARVFIRNALTLHPSGPALLKRKLLLLGVEKPLIDTALAEELGAETAGSAATDLARTFVRKARTSRKTETPEKLRQRLSAFLARRGFGWDVIKEAAATALGKDE